MNVKTSRFGVLEVATQDVFKAAVTIPGFPNSENFVFIQKQNIMPFKWLQSVEDNALTFVVVDPIHFFLDYEPCLSRFDLRSVGASSAHEVSVYSLVVLPDNMELMSANLRRPLIVNPTTRQLRQVSLSDNRWSYSESIVEAIKKQERARLQNPAMNQFPINMN